MERDGVRDELIKGKAKSMRIEIKYESSDRPTKDDRRAFTLVLQKIE
jgi:hypothetical protein